MALTYGFTPLSRAGWTAYANTSWSADWTPNKAIDGSNGSAGAGPTAPYTWWVDMGSAQTFDAVTIDTDVVAALAAIYVGDDGVNWGTAVIANVPVYSGPHVYGWPNADDPTLVRFPGGSVTKRWIKIVFNVQGGIWEFNAGTATTNTLAVRFSPHNMTSTTSPSPYVVTTNAVYDNPWNAFNGDMAGRWVGAYNGAYITLDLGAGNAKALYGYIIHTHWETYRIPKDWTMQGSNDGSNWTILHTVTNNPGVWASQSFYVGSTTQYRYHKINITASVSSGDWVQMSELTLYAPLSSSYSLDVSETISLNSTLFLRNELDFADQVSLAETEKFALSRNPQDSLVPIDAMHKLTRQFFAETVSLSDRSMRVSDLVEQFSLEDRASWHKSVTFDDQNFPSDAGSKSLARTLSDDEPLSDSTYRQFDVVEVDIVSLTEVVSFTVPHYNFEFLDVITMVDGLLPKQTSRELLDLLELSSDMDGGGRGRKFLDPRR